MIKKRKDKMSRIKKSHRERFRKKRDKTKQDAKKIYGMIYFKKCFAGKLILLYDGLYF